MTFLELVQRLHSESLRSTAAPTSVTGATDRNARLFNRVADAWRELQLERDWRWMRTTTDAALTVGLQTYSAADLSLSRFKCWRAEDSDYYPGLYISGSPNTFWPLQFEQLDRFRQEWIYITTANSTPVAWSTDESHRLLVGPAPAVAYKLRAEYWMEPSTLAADGDTPDMPARFHMLLVWRALQDVAIADAKPELLTLAQQNYATMHGQLMLDQARMPYLG
jgi:hypothetical protein